MMQFGIYGTKGSLQAEFTDNQPGQVRVVLDRLAGHKPFVALYEAERDPSAYGHGATVICYMRHFQKCLDENCEPSPSVVDGAKSVAAVLLLPATNRVKEGLPPLTDRSGRRIFWGMSRTRRPSPRRCQKRAASGSRDSRPR